MLGQNKLSLTTKVFIGLVLGSLFGLILPDIAPSLKIVGDLFVRAIRMVILPLILLCVTAGVAQLGDMRTVGKSGVGMLVYAAVVNLCSSLAGVLVGVLVNPAKGVDIPSGLKAATVNAPSAKDIILSIIPDNIFTALTANNMLAIIFFSMLVGIAIIMSKEKGQKLLAVVQSGSDVVAQLIGVIIKFTPYAVFALLAVTIAQHGAAVLGSLAKLLAAIWVGTTLFVVLWTFVVCTLVTKKSWFKFISSTAEAVMMALATCSGAATMPLNVANTEKFLGVPKQIGAMVIGTGTVIINGGSSFYKAIATYFVATLYGATLTVGDLTIITVLSAFIITAGVPAAGTLTAAVILTYLGVPLEGIGMLMGIDRLRDMISTAGNVVVQSNAASTIHTISGEKLKVLP